MVFYNSISQCLNISRGVIAMDDQAKGRLLLPMRGDQYRSDPALFQFFPEPDRLLPGMTADGLYREDPSLHQDTCLL